MRTTLYRFFDAHDRLLYVGIAGNPARRAHQHSKEKEWWVEVTHSTYEHFDTREEAAAAEVAAIITERPAHNVVHNDNGSVQRPVRRSGRGSEFRPNPGLRSVEMMPSGLSAAQHHNLMQALSDIANSLGREAFGENQGQEAFAQWVASMARMCCYADWCGPCAMASGDNPSRYPVACKVTPNGFLRAAYLCPQCGHSWMCGWSVDAPWITT